MTPTLCFHGLFLFKFQDVFNLLPNLNVAELVKGFSGIQAKISSVLGDTSDLNLVFLCIFLFSLQ